VLLLVAWATALLKLSYAYYASRKVSLDQTPSVVLHDATVVAWADGHIQAYQTLSVHGADAASLIRIVSPACHPNAFSAAQRRAEPQPPSLSLLFD
jgi:hypothetical protein